jgi:triosephosphate isomerase
MELNDIKQIVRNELVASILETQEFLIVGNWKMNKTKDEVKVFLDDIANHDFGNKNTVVIIPPSAYLYLFEDQLRFSQVLYGTQNFYPKENGAFTGEFSIDMMKDFGCKYALAGHSERREIFMECDAFTAKKVRACLKNQIKPILCIGENLDQRQTTDYKQFLIDQLKRSLDRVEPKDLSNVIVAYEPIWAIGTGETATPEQVEEIHMHLRKFLVEQYGSEIGKEIPLLYGGSVNAKNVKELALAESVSGFLIGGASLNAKTLIEISNILNGK